MYGILYILFLIITILSVVLSITLTSKNFKIQIKKINTRPCHKTFTKKSITFLENENDIVHRLNVKNMCDVVVTAIFIKNEDLNKYCLDGNEVKVNNKYNSLYWSTCVLSHPKENLFWHDFEYNIDRIKSGMFIYIPNTIINLTYKCLLLKLKSRITVISLEGDEPILNDVVTKFQNSPFIENFYAAKFLSFRYHFTIKGSSFSYRIFCS